MQRPKEATVFGVLCLVFACLGILGVLVSLPMFLGLGPKPDDPVNSMLFSSPAYLLYSKISLAIHGVASAVLLTIGIGLLGLKRWSRRWAIGYGIYAIAAGLIGNVFAAIFVYVPLFDRLQGAERVVVYITLGGAIFGFVLGMAFPSLMIYFLTRSHVVQAFEPGGPSTRVLE